MSKPGVAGIASFGSPATYRIVVQGELNDVWISRFSPKFAVESKAAGECEGGSETTLVGRMEDEAELFGFLDTLYSLHLPLLQLVREENAAHEAQRTLSTASSSGG